MDNALNRIFDTVEGREIYARATLAISDNSMDSAIKRGVLVGFSGGADSLMLLAFLLEYRRRNFDFPIIAVHVNHMIRGNEADEDENFSKRFADSLGVEFIAVRRDIPKVAKEKSMGIEEAARNERYSIFRDIIRGRNDISTVAVAHNSTDNVETVIFNMMRGAGTLGLCGIQPCRDNIIRPLIYCPSDMIRAALSTALVRYSTDSTNQDTAYTRNYIRHEIIPRLRHLSSSPEDSIKRSSQNLRRDNDYLASLANEITSGHGKTYDREFLASLHPSILGRVVKNMAADFTDATPEAVHLEKINIMLPHDNFAVSLPGGISFVSQQGVCFINRENCVNLDFSRELSMGENVFEEFSAKLILSYEKPSETSLNVYNFSIYTAVPCDIIRGGLSIRPKLNGDTYRCGGVTHKVKRMLCDAKVPPTKRGLIPLICDEDGILWIPGFKPRDYSKTVESKLLYITLAITDIDSDTRFCTAKEWDKVRKA